ncbi:hypothetical protein BJ508DRAFT_334835 [Ascobolus immersus RN42]|uniref:Uncharacterized protein n=1 Tax=Ascobolus immersus RN42 TaxID=1160509 RepID=A0A3N4HEP7_ASCIM|nr:hypothetical protein BJ508DRAFT_334835 [Ascobolus immersus RN42]
MSDRGERRNSEDLYNGRIRATFMERREERGPREEGPNARGDSRTNQSVYDEFGGQAYGSAHYLGYPESGGPASRRPSQNQNDCFDDRASSGRKLQQTNRLDLSFLLSTTQAISMTPITGWISIATNAQR